MKREFVKAEVKVIKFECEDILTMSEAYAKANGYSESPWKVGGEYVYYKSANSLGYNFIANTSPQIYHHPLSDRFMYEGGRTASDADVNNAIQGCRLES